LHLLPIEPEHEIARKALDVSPNRLVERLHLYAIQSGQITIEHCSLPPDKQDAETGAALTTG
jgi:hypothetical protein